MTERSTIGPAELYTSGRIMQSETPNRSDADVGMGYVIALQAQ